MRTEIELTKSTPYYHSLYFQERGGIFDHGVQLCARGMRRYVELPKDAEKITLCFFKRYVPESFEIGRRVVKRKSYNSLMFAEIACYCMADHPQTQLLQSFRHELYRYYINGYKFFRIEY